MSTLNNSWTMVNDWANIPAQTRTIQFRMTGTRNAGTDNDFLFDNLFLRVGSEDENCNMLTATSTPARPFVYQLEISPNPMSEYANIKIPETGNDEEVLLQMIDSQGRKVNPPL